MPDSLSSWAAEKPLGISAVFWTGAAIAVAVALVLRYTAPGRRFQAVGANPRAAWMAGLRVRSHVVFAYTAAGVLYAVAAILLAGVRISIDPAFGASYLLAPIAAVVLAGAALSGGLASATSTWVAAIALTFLTQMLLIFGLSAALQFIVFGGAIIVGMLVSGDRVASLLGRLLRRVEASAGTHPEVRKTRAEAGSRKEARWRVGRSPRCHGNAHGGWARRHFSCSGPRSRSRSSRRVAGAPAARRQQPRSRRRSSARGRGSARSMPRRRRRLQHTLFKATLLPKDKMSRNIALAGLGRADRKVNEALALKCWKNNGCSTGTGGKLTVAYIEQFGENVYRQMSKMEFILQALTYRDVGRIIYSSAHSDFTKAFADWKAAIAQGVDLIVTYPDFGDAMIPVMKQATDAGIPVATYAWGFVSDPGKNYLTVVGEDTCALGKTYAYVMNNQLKSGEIAFLGGFPGNPLSEGWQKCEEPALRPAIDVVAKEPTNWDPSKVQQVVAGILAKNPTSRAGATSTGSAWARVGTRRTRPRGRPSTAS